MVECQRCGSFVTPDFARVFGSNNDEVYACPDCTTFNRLHRGEADGPGVR